MSARLTPPKNRLAACAAALAAATVASHAVAGTDGYLRWHNKAVQPAVAPSAVAVAPAPAPVQTPAYAVPPSPYGQVGNPYRTLTWAGKTRPQAAPQQSASIQPPAYDVPRPVQTAPVYRPAPVREDAVRHDMVADQQPAPQFRQPQPRPAPVQAQPAVMAPPAAPAHDDSAYQVPATSPYAARIAAARASQAADQARQQQLAAQAPPAAKPAPVAAKTTKTKTAKPVAVATAAPAATPTVSPDQDPPFVPGELAANPSQEPRLYSLHRQYGLKPDPITVDSPTGAQEDLTLKVGIGQVTSGDSDSQKTDTTPDPGAADDPDAPGAESKAAAGDDSQTKAAIAAKTTKTTP